MMREIKISSDVISLFLKEKLKQADRRVDFTEAFPVCLYPLQQLGIL